jgi:hypothetical protein
MMGPLFAGTLVHGKEFIVNYFIHRDGQQDGPYTLADLQRLVGSGEVLTTALASCEMSSDPVPISQIVAVPPSASLVAAIAEARSFPNPPNLYWVLLLVLDVLTLGLFVTVWDIVQAVWLNKLETASKALFYYIIADACALGGFVIFAAAPAHTSPGPVPYLFQVVAVILVLIGRFSFRSSMEKHFNGPDPIGLSLGGVMTFFFGGIYFQYHINDIVRRRRNQQDTISMMIVFAVLQFLLLLVAFCAGSFLPIFLILPAHIMKFANGTRGFEWDGVFLMLALVIVILLIEALRKRIRSAAPWTALALFLAAIAGLAMKFGFRSFDQ